MPDIDLSCQGGIDICITERGIVKDEWLWPVISWADRKHRNPRAVSHCRPLGKPLVGSRSGREVAAVC